MAEKHKILIVDDDKDILELLKYNLEKDGYDVYVEKNSVHSIKRAMQVHPELIILDIMMPEMNGLQVCDQLRRTPDFKETFIFFLTAKSQKLLQMQAFEIGGDDFIEKITGLRSLSHKVSSVLDKNLIIRKRAREVEVNGLSLDRAQRVARFNGKKIVLSQYEFELLFFFAQNPKKIITRENLLPNIWGSDIYLVAKSVDFFIQNVCSKLGAGVICSVRDGRYKLNTQIIN
jgi:two-component system, OmpR family, alkaline phosphatase synthesis response regulator PhoP